jgi:hypothetical protein
MINVGLGTVAGQVIGGLRPARLLSVLTLAVKSSQRDVCCK